MNAPQTVIVVLVGILSLYLGVSCYAFRLAFRRGKHEGRGEPLYENEQLVPFRDMRRAAIAYAEATPHEEVSIRARDGLTLRAKLYDIPDAVGSILLFHGYRSFGECDFGCILTHYRDRRRLRILLVDQRAHGDSEGKYITFGTLERYDCVDFANYMEERFGKHPIILDGMSMGAATVLLAAAEPLPASVVGILADCAYSSPAAILSAVGRRMWMPVSLILPGVRLFCRLFGHFDPMPVSVPAAVSASTLPILMIHGEADGFVPCEMGRQNAAARQDIRFITIPGADHGMSYLVDPETVTRELDAFLDALLPPNSCT